jgi:hypothetical protein
VRDPASRRGCPGRCTRRSRRCDRASAASPFHLLATDAAPSRASPSAQPVCLGAGMPVSTQQVPSENEQKETSQNEQRETSENEQKECNR